MGSTQFSVHTKVTVLSGSNKRVLQLKVDGKLISVPLDEKTHAHYKDQLWREHPSQKQRDVHATVKSLMRAAYLKGCADGKQ
ncbi:MAG: hypothetical protein WBF04_24120 [Candidatus Sulfotelmatobacter sp.]|jgi:hypothetical protein